MRLFENIPQHSLNSRAFLPFPSAELKTSPLHTSTVAGEVTEMAITFGSDAIVLAPGPCAHQGSTETGLLHPLEALMVRGPAHVSRFRKLKRTAYTGVALVRHGVHSCCSGGCGAFPPPAGALAAEGEDDALTSHSRTVQSAPPAEAAASAAAEDHSYKDAVAVTTHGWKPIFISFPHCKSPH